MRGPREIEFWFEFASTYSHLSAMRIEDALAGTGLALTWRPFLLGPVFKAQGWNDSPFNIYPLKGQYMWRDMERRAARYGIPFQRPGAFPRPSIAAARIALLAADEGWGPDFTKAVFIANFADDRDIASDDVLKQVLSEIGRDAEPVFEAIASDEVKRRLRDQTNRATGLGIFGAPSFTIDGELFWGDDRLEDAIEFASG